MRLSTKVVVFNLWLSAAANVIVESGIANAFGAEVQPGASAKLQEAKASASNIGAGGIGGETLAGMFITAGQTVEAIIQAMFAAPIMFTNLGVPSLLVGFVFAPMVVIAGLDILYVVTGRDI